METNQLPTLNWHVSIDNLGGKIKEYRKSIRLTQSVLEKKSGVPQTMLSQFENGWRTPSLITFLKIAIALGASTDDLLSLITYEEDEKWHS